MKKSEVEYKDGHLIITADDEIIHSWKDSWEKELRTILADSHGFTPEQLEAEITYIKSFIKQ